jgi:hypothetical protein
MASPFAVTVSTTSAPVTLAIATVAAVELPLAEALVGADWTTPENETDPAAIAFDWLSVTVIVALPLAGASRYQISVRFWFPGPFCAARNVSAVPPYVTPLTVVFPSRIEMPTTRMRLGFVPTVCDHDSDDACAGEAAEAAGESATTAAFAGDASSETRTTVQSMVHKKTAGFHRKVTRAILCDAAPVRRPLQAKG